MNHRVFGLSPSNAHRYYNDLIVFDRFAQDMLKSGNPDVHMPYWVQVVEDNRTRFEYFGRYLHLLSLRS